MNLSLLNKNNTGTSMKRRILDFLVVSFLTLEVIFIILFLFCSKMMDTFNVYIIVFILLTIFIVSFSIFFYLKIKHKNILKIIFLVITLFIISIICISLFFSNNSKYEEVDEYKNNIFSKHKVMIVVPHEDDDINLFGGLYEQYISYGSDVYTVFVTNGDKDNNGKQRINEAIDCMELCGVPEKNVIFLGYGDQWKEKYPHIYNAFENEIVESYIGKTQTYGIDSHPSFNDSSYTNINYLNDLKNVILTIKPDVIYCVDNDNHIDHKATSLAFEKVIGQILKEETGYRPTVLKGFAYKTAWTAKKDFYSKNILSTIEPTDDSGSSYFEWNSRIRIPIKADTISRSLIGSKMYKELNCYASQNAIFEAESIINGDKVFWERPTESLIYDSTIKVSSGNGELLNDFMLFDNYNLKSDIVNYSDGIWIPEVDDQEKTITIKLNDISDVKYIYLYDNPSLEDNVLNAEITLDNGEIYQTGELNKNGSATIFKVNSIGSKEILIKLTKHEGDYAGLSEIEIYNEKPKTAFDFIKIMDANDNFVYDYITNGEATLKIYNSNLDNNVNLNDYDVFTDNENCIVTINNEYINVKCPKNEKCILTVVNRENQCKDSVVISNKNSHIEIKQDIEKRLNTIFNNVIDVYYSLFIQ